MDDSTHFKHNRFLWHQKVLSLVISACDVTLKEPVQGLVSSLQMPRPPHLRTAAVVIAGCCMLYTWYAWSQSFAEVPTFSPPFPESQDQASTAELFDSRQLQAELQARAERMLQAGRPPQQVDLLLSQRPPNHHVFVMHIPKTGGVSLALALRTLARKSGLTICGEYPVFNLYNCSNPLWHELSLEDRSATAIVEGHFRRGLEAYLPSGHTFAYVATLRRPVRRLLSQMLFYPYNMTMEEFANPALYQGCNWQTAFVFGHGYSQDQRHLWRFPQLYLTPLCPPHGPDHDMVIAAAKQQLGEFQAVLILEEWAASLCLLAHRVWGDHRVFCGAQFPVRNAAANRPVPEQAELAEEILGPVNRLDIQLYEHGVELLHRRLKDVATCTEAKVIDGLYDHPGCT